MSQQPAPSATEHQAISLLLPWYVNATLDATDKQRVEAHVARCSVCRADLALESRIYARLATDVVVDHIPAASLKRLQSRLDGLELGQSTRKPQGMAARPGRRWLAAAAVLIAAAAGAIGFYVSRASHLPSHGSPPAYYTVTDSEKRPSSEVIRAVFAPNITLVELQALLEEAQVKIVAGPTEAGVYSLAARSSRPVSLSLALLRAHQTVRFAEITQERPASTKEGDMP